MAAQYPHPIADSHNQEKGWFIEHSFDDSSEQHVATIKHWSDILKHNIIYTA